MLGLKFIDSSGEILIETKLFGDPKALKRNGVCFKKIKLAEGERLLGVESGERGHHDARHYDVKFYIGSEKNDTHRFG